MIYIYCGAFKPLLYALSLRNIGEKITIITHDKQVIEYCKIENIECINYKMDILKVTSFYKIFDIKKTLKKILEKLDIGNNNCFILTGNAKIFDAFYLVKEFSKKGGVVYYKDPHERELKYFKGKGFKKIFFRGIFIKLVLKIFMGLDLIYYELNQNPCFGINEKYFKKYNVMNYNQEVGVEELILDLIKNNKTNYKQYDTLIIDDGPTGTIIKNYSLENIYKSILENPHDLVFKKHPNQILNNKNNTYNFYKLFENYDELPKHIPVELFCNNINKNVISVCSASLVTASQIKHLKAISLLRLIDWYHESFKEEVENQLKNASNDKILFPNNIKELKEILSN